MLNLVVALGAEAAPLVVRYRLQPAKESAPFPLFVGDGLRLIVSGMGRVNAAAAVAWLAGTENTGAGEQPFNQIWFNLGIGGSRAFPRGCLVIAREVTEAASGRRWRVPLAGFSTPATQIVTVDQPETNYSRPAVYDMEASGFLSAARRVGRRDLVHCVKVISDGTDSLATELTGESVRGLIAGAMAEIETLIARLSRLQASGGEAQQNPGAEEFLARWEFSTEQICKLQRLLQCAAREGIGINIARFAQADAGAFLLALEAQIA